MVFSDADLQERSNDSGGNSNGRLTECSIALAMCVWPSRRSLLLCVCVVKSGDEKKESDSAFHFKQFLLHYGESMCHETKTSVRTQLKPRSAHRVVL